MEKEKTELLADIRHKKIEKSANEDTAPFLFEYSFNGSIKTELIFVDAYMKNWFTQICERGGLHLRDETLLSEVTPISIRAIYFERFYLREAALI